MNRFKSLAEVLQVTEDGQPYRTPDLSEPESAEPISAQSFCQQIVDSPEFRSYLLDGVRLRILPSAVLTKILDHAWGKVPERVEHSGVDGDPIITEIRRVVVRGSTFSDDEDDVKPKPGVTH